MGKNHNRISPTMLITEAVRQHNALVVLVHPNEPILHSLSLRQIREFREQLPDYLFNNVGIEVNNWSANYSLLFNEMREYFVKRTATKLGLAHFGLADFHNPYFIDSQYTQFPIVTGNLSGDLATAVNNLQTRSVRGIRITPRSYLKLGEVMVSGRLHSDVAKVRQQFHNNK